MGVKILAIFTALFVCFTFYKVGEKHKQNEAEYPIIIDGDRYKLVEFKNCSYLKPLDHNKNLIHCGDCKNH